MLISSMQCRSQKILIGEAEFCHGRGHGDCSIRVTALLGYLDLAFPVFCFLEKVLVHYIH